MGGHAPDNCDKQKSKKSNLIPSLFICMYAICVVFGHMHQNISRLDHKRVGDSRDGLNNCDSLPIGWLRLANPITLWNSGGESGQSSSGRLLIGSFLLTRETNRMNHPLIPNHASQRAYRWCICLTADS